MVIAFDVAGNMPAGETITSATLDTARCNGTERRSVGRATSLICGLGRGNLLLQRRPGAAATPNDATWLYRFYDAADPALSPTWTTPGGDYSATVSAAAVITDDSRGGQLFAWSSDVNPLMLSDVQGWFDTLQQLWLVLLGDESKGKQRVALNSGESGAPAEFATRVAHRDELAHSPHQATTTAT